LRKIPFRMQIVIGLKISGFDKLFTVVF